MEIKHGIYALFILALFLAACASPTPSATPTPTSSPSSSPTPTGPTSTPLPTNTYLPTWTPPSPGSPEAQNVTFAVIGDYGIGNIPEADVASMVRRWQPDLIITVGDNNNDSGAADTIDANVGQFFHDYIYPYTGAYGPGADVNRFFPALGNNDWLAAGAQPYLDYFTLPGNERYYDFVWGPVHFFALDSNENEPDGAAKKSVQGTWLRQLLEASTSSWNIVYMHNPPYSSSEQGSTRGMRWSFASWGADAVFSGQSHTYERLLVEGIPYFVDGTGGDGLDNFKDSSLPESQFRYSANFGAVRVMANETEILFEFFNRLGDLIDSYQVAK